MRTATAPFRQLLDFAKPNLVVSWFGLVLAVLLQIYSPTFADTRTPRVVKTGQEIPRNAKSWSLFLVCAPSWLEQNQNSNQKLAELHTEFLAFGNAIGSQNDAVWFSQSDSSSSAKAGLDYDAIRAADFCTEYNLKSADSPHVVVTTKYPTPIGNPGDFYALSLSGLDSEQAGTLLGQLADMVRSGHIDRDEIGSDQYWRHWAQILHTSLSKLGNLAPALSVTLNTAILKVSFSGEKLGH